MKWHRQVFLTRLRRFWRNSYGASAIEFAILGPGILLFFANVFDLSMFIFARTQVDAAAQQGARSVLVACEAITETPVTTKCTKFSTAVQSAIDSTILGNKIQWIRDVTNDEGYWCPTGANGALKRVGGLGSTAPTTECTNPGIYVRVKVEYTFVPTFGGISAMQYLPSKKLARDAYTRLL